jgi:hypothetical protein
MKKIITTFVFSLITALVFSFCALNDVDALATNDPFESVDDPLESEDDPSQADDNPLEAEDASPL